MHVQSFRALCSSCGKYIIACFFWYLDDSRFIKFFKHLCQKVGIKNHVIFDFIIDSEPLY